MTLPLALLVSVHHEGKAELTHDRRPGVTENHPKAKGSEGL